MRMRKKLICIGLVGIITAVACYTLNFGRLYTIALGFVMLKVGIAYIDAKNDEKTIESVKNMNDYFKSCVIYRGILGLLLYAFGFATVGSSFHYDDYLQDVYNAEWADASYCKWLMTSEAEKCLISEIGERVSGTIFFLESGQDWDYELMPVSDSTKHTEVARVCELANRAYMLYIEGDKEGSSDVLEEIATIYSNMQDNYGLINESSVLLLFSFFCIVVLIPISDFVKYIVVSINQKKTIVEE